jgi:hypothetical protein
MQSWPSARDLITYWTHSSQITIDRSQIVVAHSAELTPRHEVVEYMPLRILTGANRSQEIFFSPLPDPGFGIRRDVRGIGSEIFRWMSIAGEEFITIELRLNA